MSSSGNSFENMRIPLRDLMAATGNFAPKYIIGGGGFGQVYRGELSDSRPVAIKRLDPTGFQGQAEFLNELRLLSRFHHKNVIAFIGFSDEDGEMIIVYEFAHNQSLDRHLADPRKMRRISWFQRLRICIGAARGLGYLHSGLQDGGKIIHRDVKSSNILLARNLEAKISDFGLSKARTQNQVHTQVRTQIQTRVAGTPYYIDPYYHATQSLTKESDVYSFGIILFEMLCGRLVFPGHGRSQSLTELVRCFEGEGDKLTTIIDPNIKDQIHPVSLSIYTQIAYQCIEYNPKKRPLMGVVIEQLGKALQHQQPHEKERQRAIKQEYDDPEELMEDEFYSFVCEEIKAEKLWKARLPHNYKEIIDRSDQPVLYDNDKELYSILSDGIRVDGGNKFFSLSKLNGKNCVVISAMELFKNYEGNLIEWVLPQDSYKKSRFTRIARFERKEDMSNIEIATNMLSLGVTYIVTLIYRSDDIAQLRIKNESKEPTSCQEVFRGDKWYEAILCHFTNYLDVVIFNLKP